MTNRMMTTAEADDEMAQANAWIAWSLNPCGKPALDLSKLPRFVCRQSPTIPVLAVDVEERPYFKVRAVVLNSLQGAYHDKRDWPGELLGYFEGYIEGRYMIEIYGRGDPWPVKPEPEKPAFMR